jgi:hypothetical protein
MSLVEAIIWRIAQRCITTLVRLVPGAGTRVGGLLIDGTHFLNSNIYTTRSSEKDFK